MTTSVARCGSCSNLVVFRGEMFCANRVTIQLISGETGTALMGVTPENRCGEFRAIGTSVPCSAAFVYLAAQNAWWHQPPLSGVPFYDYSESGLPGIRLYYGARCCGGTVTICNITGLHRAIATVLHARDHLTAAERAFLAAEPAE